MKNARKVLLLVLCLVLVVSATVMGTMAYLTSTAEVKNTFTVGNVAITLDETDVDNSTQGAERDQRNSYKLIPGHTYTKDPIVHFAANSEASYLFVKVENGLVDAESNAESYVKIAEQITDNEWTSLTGVPNVYYKKVIANETNKAIDYPVFQNFTVSGDLTSAQLAAFGNAEIKVTAYAIQADGFEDATTAWNALNPNP